MNIIIWLFLGVLIGVSTKFIIFHFQDVSWLSMILLSVLGALLGGELHDFAQAANIPVVIFGMFVPAVHLASLGSTIAISFYVLLLYIKL